MHSLHLTATDKATRYAELLPQITSVVSSETDTIANMGNVCAMLREAFGWLWIGFYRVDTASNQLVLGPFQGSLACTRIPFGKGVCGEVWQSGQTQIVADVHAHPNHIACSSLSRSEIVLPVKNASGTVTAVLDIDAAELAAFNDVDAHYLTAIAALFTAP